MELFEDTCIQPFLEDVGLATCTKMMELLRNSQSIAILKVELAATTNAGISLVQMTYKLEGDGPLVFSCYKEIEKLIQTV